MRVDGLTALVTGGGTGIGAAVARRLAAEGASVVITGRRLEPLDEVARETGAVPVQADVANADDVERALDVAAERFGGLDIVVNNAAVAGMPWRETLEVNLTGPYLVAERAIPRLLERGGGAIVNVASVAGIVASSGNPAYSTSKAGLIMLTRSLAVTYGPRGIRVNAVCPAWVRTRMADVSMDDLGEKRGISREDAYALVSAHYPLRRVGEPDEIAAACVFLASPAASFITGAVLVADGGATVVDVGVLPWEST